MNVLEPFRWNSKFSNGWDDMALNLCLLARDTLAGPFANILLYIGPYELLSHCLAGSLNPWMTKAMDDVENATSV